MDFLGDNAYVVSTVLQGLAYLALAVLALLRIGNRWAVLALCGSLTSLVPLAWYFAATLALRLIDDSETALGSAEFFYAPAAQLLMQFLTVVGLGLLVAAVVVGRGPRKEAPPAEGPTGTTFRQLPGNIDWR